MSKYDSGSTPVSDQYKSMTIDRDTTRLNQQRQYYNNVLKPDLEKKKDAETEAYGVFYKARKNYANATEQKSFFQEEVDKLTEAKKLAMDKAREDALKRGASPDEAQKAAEKAGKSFDIQIKGMNYWQAPRLEKSVSQALSNFSSASESYTTARGQYLSADITLFGNLCSQRDTAFNISKNTQYYNFLREVESRQNNV